ncbi:hypothetical protein AND_002740 [Anopheles darlingi]|uniref:Uncharacterized protein n=1 Tax=Anopheles darlingi TaxID=43151 RepID=W5JRZ2_ANODA|nr:hypothetical protein AND_002740 [Anopheles darlingi]
MTPPPLSRTHTATGSASSVVFSHKHENTILHAIRQQTYTDDDDAVATTPSGTTRAVSIIGGQSIGRCSRDHSCRFVVVVLVTFGA